MITVDKKELKEQEIRIYITPTLKNKNYEVLNNMREEYYFTDGRIIIFGSQHSTQKGKHWENNHVHTLDSYVEDYIILDYIAMRINGMSLADYVTGTAQSKMNQEKMNSIPIPLPSLSEQHHIVTKIEELEKMEEMIG